MKPRTLAFEPLESRLAPSASAPSFLAPINDSTDVTHLSESLSALTSTTKDQRTLYGETLLQNLRNYDGELQERLNDTEVEPPDLDQRLKETQAEELEVERALNTPMLANSYTWPNALAGTLGTIPVTGFTTIDGMVLAQDQSTVTIFGGNRIALLRTADGTSLGSFTLGTNNREMVTTPDAKKAVVIDEGNILRILSLPSGAELRRVPTVGTIGKLRMNADGTQALFGEWAPASQAWYLQTVDLTTGATKYRGGTFKEAVWNPKQPSEIIMTNAANTLYTFDTAGRPPRALPAIDGGGEALTFTPDGTTILAANPTKLSSVSGTASVSESIGSGANSQRIIVSVDGLSGMIVRSNGVVMPIVKQANGAWTALPQQSVPWSKAPLLLGDGSVMVDAEKKTDGTWRLVAKSLPTVTWSVPPDPHLPVLQPRATPALTAIPRPHPIAWNAPSNLAGGAVGVLPENPSRKTNVVAPSPDGSVVATVSAGSSTVQILRTEDGALLRELTAPAAVSQLLWNGSELLSFDAMKNLTTWDPASGSIRATKQIPGASNIDLTDDGKSLIASQGATSQVIPLKTEGLSATIMTANTMAIAAGDRFVQTKDGQPFVYIFDRTNLPRLSRYLTLPQEREVTTLESVADGALVAVGTTNGVTYLIDPKTGGVICSLAGHSVRIDAIEWNGINALLATHDTSGRICLWDAQMLKQGTTPTPLTTFETGSALPNRQGMAFTADGSTLFDVVRGGRNPGLTAFTMPMRSGVMEAGNDRYAGFRSGEELADRTLPQINDHTYHRLFASADRNEQGETHLTLRVRSTRPNITIDVGGAPHVPLQKNTLSVASGIADSVSTFSLPSPLPHDVTVPIVVRDTLTGGVLLQERIILQADGRVMIPRSAEDAYFAEKSFGPEVLPIEPRLRVMDIRGPSILLQVQSDRPSSVVAIESGGPMARTTLNHDHGTAYAAIPLTFDVERPSGVYRIVLTEEGEEEELDAIAVRWESVSRTLSLVSEGASALAMPGLEDAFASSITSFDSLMTLTSTTPSSLPIRDQYYASLIEKTGSLAPELQLNRTPQEAFFTMYPQYSDTNLEQTIAAKEAELVASGRWPAGEGRRVVLQARSDLLSDYCNDYQYHFSQFTYGWLAQAVDVYHQIARGAPVQATFQIFTQNFNAFAADKPNCFDAQWIVGHGLPLLTAEKALTIGQLLYASMGDDLIRRHGDDLTYQSWLKSQLNQGMYVRADGVIAKVDGANASPAPDATMAIDRLTTKILTAFNAAIDPRVRAIIASRAVIVAGEHNTALPLQSTSLMQEVTREAVTDALADGDIVAMLSDPSYVQSRSALLAMGITDQDINDILFVQAAFSVASNNSSAMELLKPAAGSTSEAMLRTDDYTGFAKLQQLRTVVKTIDPEIVFAQTQYWYHPGTDMETVTITGVPVHASTEAGRIFLGLYQNGFSVSAVAFQDMLAYAEQVTGVNATRLWMAGRAKDYQLFARVMIDEFTTAGYGHIFWPTTLGTQIFASVKRGEDSTTVSFDAPANTPTTSTVVRTFVNGTLLPPSVVTATNRLTFSLSDADLRAAVVNVPLLSGPDTVQFELTMQLPNGSTFTTRTKHVAVELHELSSFAIPGNLTEEERAILTFNIPAELTGNRAIMDYVVRYFAGEVNGDRLTKVSETEWKGRDYGTGELQCKAWIDQVVVMNATGVDLPANETVNGETGKWNETDLASKGIAIVSRVDHTNIDSLLKSGVIQPGDIMQYYAQGIHVTYPHTVVLGNIDTDGVWVFDTNYSSDVPTTREDGSTFLREDDTVRFHKITALGKNLIIGTVYRVQTT